jgi:glycosyltransferase involved in cell wall biosynthesis
MFKVIHLVPYDAIGGVEVAAKSIDDGAHGEIFFSCLYLADKHNAETENQIGVYFRALRRLFSMKPDLVIASLWRSCVILIIYKLLRPQTRVVTFLHSACSVHWIDFAFNYLSMCLSDEIWADSHTTLSARVPERWRRKGKIISFLVDRESSELRRSLGGHFVFWGRLHAMKGLGRAIGILGQVQNYFPSVSFTIIGPDDGQRKNLEELICGAGIKNVEFFGSMARADIFAYSQRYSFYLQTSVDEGMAMSVVEAMQLGLVPVVTPVGEISRYCRDGHNAVLVEDDMTAVASILRLLDDPEEYLRLSKNAVQTWQEKPLYRDDVLEACRHVLAG